jgi:polyisoprenoid-binding protein YceI
MGSVTAYEPSHPLKQRKTAEYGTREPYYRSLVLRPRLPALLLLAFLGCSREKERPQRTEPWPAPAAVASGSAGPSVRRASYALEKSRLDFELPAKRSTPRGRFGRAAGRFDIDLESPERSSGSVRIDLTTVEMEASEDAPDDATRRALDWLELGAGVRATTRETHRFATFDFRTLEGAEGKRLSGLGTRRGREPRLDATAYGELSLHGVRAPVRVPVSLEIHASGPGAPGTIVIRSRKPLVVSLGVHDIRPRDAQGVLIARELSLLGEKVGREAAVSFELTLALEH